MTTETGKKATNGACLLQLYAATLVRGYLENPETRKLAQITLSLLHGMPSPCSSSSSEDSEPTMLGQRTRPLSWREAAMMLGESLSSDGPNGYYTFTPNEWLEWALQQVRKNGTDAR